MYNVDPAIDAIVRAVRENPTSEGFGWIFGLPLERIYHSKSC